MVYLTVGDPLATPNIPATLSEAGADLLELGLPVSKPKYDGPTVKRAMLRALGNGFTTQKALTEASRLEADGKILFTYYDVAQEMGVEELLQHASNHFRAVLFPDLLIDYPEKLELYCRLSEELGLEKVFFVTSSFPHKLIQRLPSMEASFIYLGLMISTGVMLPVSAERNIRVIRKLVGDTPLLVGFAVKTPEQVRSYVEAGADGVVIGSAVLRLLEETSAEERLERLRSFVSSIREALDTNG